MQSSPPENRAKNVMTQAASSQRIGAVMSRTNSHDSTPKSARSHKVCLSLFSMPIFSILSQDRFRKSFPITTNGRGNQFHYGWSSSFQYG